MDAGLSMREMARRLEAIGEELSRIDAILITHEHSDHVSGLPVLARSRNVRAQIYMTRLTAPGIDWGKGVPRLAAFQAGATLDIGDVEVQTFSVPHDAVDPVGFCFETQGVRIGMITDLGYIPESVKYHLRRTDLLLIEANHDLEMLKVGPYPWSVKQRVMSRVGHLSNLCMSDYLASHLDCRTSHVVLAHLSDHNNHPAIVETSAADAMEERGLRAQLHVAVQDRVSEVFTF